MPPFATPLDDVDEVDRLLSVITAAVRECNNVNEDNEEQPTYSYGSADDVVRWLTKLQSNNRIPYVIESFQPVTTYVQLPGDVRTTIIKGQPVEWTPCDPEHTYVCFMKSPSPKHYGICTGPREGERPQPEGGFAHDAVLLYLRSKEVILVDNGARHFEKLPYGCAKWMWVDASAYPMPVKEE